MISFSQVVQKTPQTDVCICNNSKIQNYSPTHPETAHIHSHNHHHIKKQQIFIMQIKMFCTLNCSYFGTLILNMFDIILFCKQCICSCTTAFRYWQRGLESAYGTGDQTLNTQTISKRNTKDNYYIKTRVSYTKVGCPFLIMRYPWSFPNPSFQMVGTVTLEYS